MQSLLRYRGVIEGPDLLDDPPKGLSDRWMLIEVSVIQAKKVPTYYLLGR